MRPEDTNTETKQYDTAPHSSKQHWWSEWMPYDRKRHWRRCQYKGCPDLEIKEFRG